MRAASKLSSEQRRAAIIKAVRRVFADKGFHGTTTRELAQAAGVSEALLFKHFPHKEALFSAIKDSCCREQDLTKFQRLHNLESSTSTLVRMVHFLVELLVGSDASDAEEQVIAHRLILRSLAEDGDFARHFLCMPASDFIPKVQACVEAARAGGDAVDGPVRPDLSGWFILNLAAAVKHHLLPAVPVIDYGVPRDQLVDQVAWFVLRGLGLKEQAIRRYYDPKALVLFDD